MFCYAVLSIKASHEGVYILLPAYWDASSSKQQQAHAVDKTH